MTTINFNSEKHYSRLTKKSYRYVQRVAKRLRAMGLIIGLDLRQKKTVLIVEIQLAFLKLSKKDAEFVRKLAA
ncbi:MAG: hypothetical protein AAGA75_14720 [Cyanobacteria bacterium P01_E01_bin.6]